MTKGTPKTKFAIIIPLMLGISPIALAELGPIAQKPLFLGSTTPPNLMFVVDDSTSMRYEIIYPDSPSRNGQLIPNERDENDDFRDFIHNIDCPPSSGAWYGYGYVLQIRGRGGCGVTAEEEWRSRDHTYNPLYYNPNRRYEPWAGVDADGNPFQDMDIRNARIDPYDPNSPTIDLLEESAIFWSPGRTRDYYDSERWLEWCDEQGVPHDRCRGWRYYYYDDGGNRRMRWVHELPEEGDGDTIDTQTNFANWFSYHRSRAFAAKYAYSRVISELENFRIGLTGLLNRGEEPVSTPTAVAIDDATPSHKEKILDTLLRSNSSVGNTHLRNTLNMVGRYFETGAPLTSADEGGFDGRSPILEESEGGACQMNATILMTDGYYNGGLVSPIGNEDQGAPNDTLFDGPPFGDRFRNTLADVAMHFFERDLAPSLPDLVVPTPNETSLFERLGMVPPETLHQHLNTYTIAFGVRGTLDPSTLDPFRDGFAWPDPRSGNRQKIDDLLHAAFNGRGEFLSANDPHELVSALRAAIDSIDTETGSPSRVEFSTYYLDDESLVFVSRFQSKGWTGELEAYRLGPDLRLGALQWRASEGLEEADRRQIVSYDETRGEGIAFRWRELSGESRRILGSEELVDYLRGEEAPGFRRRESLLGDIVNSGPLYIGKPSFFFPSKPPFGTPGNHYADFRNAQADRTPVVWVGANDGMLHGFDARTGEELLAYVPRMVHETLPELADPGYSHRYYVDGTPSHLDAFLDGRWRTILTGGLGAGGKGWYALDVTNPDTFDESNADEIVLWEFAEGDDLPPRAAPDSPSSVGYSFSQPQVIVTPASDGRGGNRWAVVTGNGYDSDSGIATLFVLFLDADLRDGRWDLYEDYVVLSTGVGTATDKNGLSSPLPVDSDGDWITDRVYAGDVMGNLWAFDLSDANPRHWGVADGGDPLFTATNASGERQPITARPAAARHPLVRNDSTNSPSLLIFFGTGQYITTDAASDRTTQSFYAVWDRGVGGLDRNDLTAQQVATLQTTTADRNATVDIRTTTDHEVPYRDNDADGRYGWYIDLDHEFAATGERVTSAAQVRNGVVYFDTFAPRADRCAPGVETWLMNLDYLNGGPPPRPVIDLNADLRVDVDDYIDVDGTLLPASGTRIEGGMPGGTTNFTATAAGSPGEDDPPFRARRGGIPFSDGRISWKELRP